MTPIGPDLRDLSPAELAAWLAERGHPRYRAGQIMDWLYVRPVERAADMANLPAALREQLSAFRLELPVETRRLTSSDGAVKLGLACSDSELIETVWMPEDGGRATLCVSSQAGCRMACRFCRTGQGGFRRNLTPAEIVGQVLAASRALGPIRNLVFMGMGEPLDNLEHLVRALAILTHPKGFGYGPRRITVSTIGDPRALERFSQHAPPVNLAVSLHSAVPATRASLMPAAAARDLDGLHAALARHPVAERDRLTIEVVLVGGVNDSIAEAKALAAWAAGLPAKVNLIRFNPFPESGLAAPHEDAVLAYQKLLRGKGIPAFIRQSRGSDILAACGQLLAD